MRLGRGSFFYPSFVISLLHEMTCSSPARPRKKRRVLLNIFLHPMLSIKYQVSSQACLWDCFVTYSLCDVLMCFFGYLCIVVYMHFFLQFLRLGATFLKCAQRLMQIKFTGKALKRNSEVKISLTFLTGAWEISLYD